jgi:hypothetical protein
MKKTFYVASIFMVLILLGCDKSSEVKNKSPVNLNSVSVISSEQSKIINRSKELLRQDYSILQRSTTGNDREYDVAKENAEADTSSFAKEVVGLKVNNWFCNIASGYGVSDPEKIDCYVNYKPASSKNPVEYTREQYILNLSAEIKQKIGKTYPNDVIAFSGEIKSIYIVHASNSTFEFDVIDAKVLKSN